jgi:signal peptidase
MKLSLAIGTMMATAILVAVPPVALGTRAFPVAIVRGNSMLPAYSSGDLLVFTGAPTSPSLQNGTVVVYLTGGTGLSILDFLIPSVEIHRIVATVVQPQDGMIYYRTKGDNNQFPDDGLVKASSILGVPALKIPYVGLVLDFVHSQQGMILITAAILFGYLNGQSEADLEGKQKKKLLALLAKRTMNGEIRESTFKEYEMALDYSGEIRPEELRSPHLASFTHWLKGNPPNVEWGLREEVCPICGSIAVHVEGSRRQTHVICPWCIEHET